MRTKNEKNSYSEEIASRYLSSKDPIINVSSEIEIQYQWIDGKRMEEVQGYKLYFVQNGVNPFAVKFIDKPMLPPLLAEIKLNKVEAIEIRSNVYFKAESLQVVK